MQRSIKFKRSETELQKTSVKEDFENQLFSQNQKGHVLNSPWGKLRVQTDMMYNTASLDANDQIAEAHNMFFVSLFIEQRSFSDSNLSIN